MAGPTPPLKLEDEVLRKFYRSFHKHGPPNWAKMSKDTKLLAEQCEMLHKQHMSFLSLPASPALETAFLALVDDHYNAAQDLIKDEMQEEDVVRGGRPRRGELEEAEAQVATSGSQKPRRTPKPTPQRLAADEEQLARRLAKANQATPKSARAKIIAKPPPSPPHAEWTSSQRKRSRRLFEDDDEVDLPRYRSPVLDRWRGRHNTDVDEGVDALLSLASGAHAASLIDNHPVGTDMASNTADPEYDAQEQDEPDPVQDTPPKKLRGARGARATPTPSGTPVKGGLRSSAAAVVTSADVAPVPSMAGIRSPKARSGLSMALAAAPVQAAANTSSSGRATSRPKKEIKKERELRETPTSSQQGGEPDAAHELLLADASEEARAVAAEDNETGAAGRNDSATPDFAPMLSLPTSPGPSGRPVRKRKPTAIALAAAAAAEEEDSGSGRGVRSVVAAVAAAVAAAEATQAAAVASEQGTASPPSEDGGGSSHMVDITTNTEALLASVPPVRTRASARLACGGPSSRRAGERGSTPAAAAAVGAEASTREGTEDGGAVSEAVAEPGPSQEAPAAVPASGRAKASSQQAAHGPADNAVRFGPCRASNQPPPGRTRRRKSLPERLPPMWEQLKVPPPQHSQAGHSLPWLSLLIPGVGAAAGSLISGGLTSADLAAAEAEAALPMPATEIALRNCLGAPRVRRWCFYEFLYSALDRPWFLRNELLEFCALHMQLPTTKLTRLEWSVLRAALGRPRRLSQAFLREERLRLEGYREHSRLKYEEVSVGMEVPHELPRQLRVGQEVVAKYPFSRQLHDGVILTVKGNKYRVQFHRGDLMTEVIRDTDVMPVDPHECLPPSMAIVPFILNGRPYDATRQAGVRGMVPAPGLPLRPPTLPMRPLGSYTMGLDTQMMREHDVAMVAEVQRALEVKEELVAQLTQLNNEAASGLHTDENGGRTDIFQLKYTNVVLKLRDTNAVLEAALTRLQNRQQQISVAATATAFGPALTLQQQLPVTVVAGSAAAVAPAAAAPNTSGSTMTVGGATVGLVELPSQQQLLQHPQSEALPLTPPEPLAGPNGLQSHPTPQTPPAQASQQQPLPLPAPSPTTSSAAGPALASQLAAGVAGPSMAGARSLPAAGKAAAQLQPSSPGPPLIVPPPRPSSAAAVAATCPLATAPTSFAFPTMPMGLALTASSLDQLVDLARAEARIVVDGCRGKVASGPSLLVSSGPPPVPAVTPITLQTPGRTSVPLAAVLPQQLMLPPPGSSPDRQPQEHATLSLALVPSSHVLQRDYSDSGDLERRMQGFNVLGDSSGRDMLQAYPADPSSSALVSVKVEVSSLGRLGCEAAGAASADQETEGNSSGGPPSSTRQQPITEEELAESWLRDVIVGCVGVLFTIQKCTAGNVPAATVGEALDLAVQQLRIRTDGENDSLYADIVQSVQGLKGHLTRAFA